MDRTRVNRGGKLMNWDLPRGTEYPRERRCMKKSMRKNRRATDRIVIRESLTD